MASGPGGPHREAPGHTVIASVLIPLIGAGGTGLILLLGFLWRARIVLAAGVLALLMVTCWALYPRDGVGTREAEAVPAPTPVPPTMHVMSWGQQDGLHIDDTTGDTGPGHVVYATVAITAGGTALSVPSIFESNPRHRMWLTVTDDGRTSDEIRRTAASDGTPLLLVPSHNDELVRRSEGQLQVLPIPGPECTDLQPGNRCEITLAWWFHGTGPVAGIAGLTLASAGVDPTTPPSSSAEAAYLPWPGIPAEPECTGAMKQWCC